MSASFAGLARPTILQIVPTLEIGGAERTTVDIARAVVRAGGRALVVSSGGRLTDELAQAGAEHIDMAVQSKNPIVMALNVEHLTRLIVREKVDLVHARSRAPAWSALAAARRTSRPFVTTYHSKVHETPRLKVFYNSVMARGDAVIANSTYTAARIRKVHAPDAARVFTVPRGIDTVYFDPDAVSPARVAALRTKFGIADSVRNIFMLPARLTRWKGQALAVEAAAKLKAKGRDDFLLLLVGDAQGRDAYVQELEKSIRAGGLSVHVRLTGACNDMPAAYALADVVLSPSIEPEPFGRTAVEAQAMRKPVIASDSGGQRETVLTPEHADGGATGLAVEAGDAATLAAAMAAMLDLDGAERMAMGARGRANVLAHYSVEAMAEATLAIYARLIRPSHG
ncbi:glycosyltransferase family 4 protein [Parvibaculum sp.]|uniref:glycosyltransferase family 4 protein n=1 Tax=Parvibaculum sp. TaxID=2024848 RepID=UPI0025E6205E|nr:glycosyltransferase family 4 protein [Parvibaculum sp.]